MDKEPLLSTTMCKIFQIQQKIHVENEYWHQILARNSSIEALAAFSLAFLLFSQVRSFCDTIPRAKCRVPSSSLYSPPQCNCPSRCPRRRSAGAKVLRWLAVSPHPPSSRQDVVGDGPRAVPCDPEFLFVIPSPAPTISVILPEKCVSLKFKATTPYSPLRQISDPPQ